MLENSIGDFLLHIPPRTRKSGLLLSLDFGLLCSIVACYFRLLSFPLCLGWTRILFKDSSRARSTVPV